MATVAKLAVDLVLDSKNQFGKKLDTSAQNVKKFGKTVNAQNSILKNYGKTVLAIAGPAVLGRLVTSSLATADALGKVSEKLGIAVEDLQTLRFAVSQTSQVTDKQFDDALQRMVRGVSEASQGIGLAGDAIKDLGLDIDKMAKLDPAAQFRMISDAMVGVGNQGDRVRIAFQLFGRAGAGLTNTLQLMPGQLEDIEQEARSLGLVMSKDITIAAAAANDAMDRWQRQLSTSFTIAVGTAVKGVQNLSDVLMKTEGSIGQRNTLADLERQYKNNTLTIGEFIKEVKELDLIVQAQSPTLEAYNQAIAGQAKRVNDSRDATKGLAGDVVALGEATMQFVSGPTSWKTLSDGILTYDQSLAQASETMRQISSDNLAPFQQGLVDKSIEEQGIASNAAMEQQTIDLYAKRQILRDTEEQAVMLHLERQKNAEQEAAIQITAFWQESMSNKAQIVGGILGNLTVLMQSENRKQFEIGKYAAISQTVLSTYEGAQKAFTSLAGIPVVGPSLGIAAAATATAAGLFRIGQIKNTQFGQSSASGGSPAVGAVSGNGSAAATSAEPQIKQELVTQYPFIMVDALQGIFDQANEANVDIVGIRQA